MQAALPAIPTLHDFVEPYAHYPKAIQSALFRVEAHPTFSILTKTIRRVFKALVTRCNKHDGCSPIMARVDRLAEEADCSEKTVQRALNFLKAAKWLVQVGDGRDDNGSYTYRTFQFTEAVVRLLALPMQASGAQKTKLSDGLYIELTLKEDQPDTPGDSSLKKEPKTQTPVTLPPELAALPAELGIKDTGIAKLRGEAFKAGYQLEHVVACAKAKLLAAGAKGGRAFRYLQTMISRKSDYAGRAAQEARSAAQAVERAKRAELEQKCAGKRFVGPQGIVYRFLTAHNVEVLQGGRIVGNWAGSQLADLYSQVERGELQELIATNTVTAPPDLAAFLKSGGVSTELAVDVEPPPAQVTPKAEGRAKLADMLAKLNAERDAKPKKEFKWENGVKYERELPARS